MVELTSRHLLDIDLSVDAPAEIGNGPFGGRRIVRVTGGSFEGERIKGTVHDGGGDWILVRHDDVFQLDVRVTLETDDGALIYMTYRGLRHGPAEVLQRIAAGEQVDGSEYYFRTAPAFETGSEKYAWLNKIIAVGVGERRAGGVHYAIFEIT